MRTGQQPKDSRETGTRDDQNGSVPRGYGQEVIVTIRCQGDGGQEVTTPRGWWQDMTMTRGCQGIKAGGNNSPEDARLMGAIDDNDQGCQGDGGRS